MQEAMYYKQMTGKKAQCLICPRKCIILDGDYGFCKARQNLHGKLFLKVYGVPCAVNIDPVEKKPLFHFLPGSKALSIGTSGCNLKCKFCQNWQISQALPDDVNILSIRPEELVAKAISSGCRSIAYTYTEPSVFFEYVLDTAILARKKGLKNIMVTNGFLNPEPLKHLYKYIDAANVDWKGSDRFYREYTGAWLKPVTESLRHMKEMGVWIEITNLLISSLNDSSREITKMCKWIFETLGKDTPVHFSAFHPDYIMTHIKPTPPRTLQKARDIARLAGLRYVYIGNIRLPGAADTVCPKCSRVIVNRNSFDTTANKIVKGKCDCGNPIPGIWQ